MVNASNVTAAIISFISLALLAIALATNSWVLLEDSTTIAESNDATVQNTSSTLNPAIVNEGLDGLRLEYTLQYFGLWVSCYRENSQNKLSCGFINSGCNATICWTRNRVDRTCHSDRLYAIPQTDCISFRVVRAFTILSTIFLIFAAALLLVATCVPSRNLLWSAAVLAVLAALCGLIAFAVFYAVLFNQSGLQSISNLGWSFIMLIVSWPLAIIATIFSGLAAFATPSKQYDYDDSE